MGNLLIKIGQILFGSMGKRVLVGMGLGVFTSAIGLTIVNYYIAKILSSIQLGGVLSFGVGLLGLAGVDKALSIMIGAYVIKYTLQSTKLGIGKITK